MDTLTKLAMKYGTDKCPPSHSYTSYYYELFKDMRQSVKKVLEIGAWYGASLRMWRDFFPNAMIYSADIDDRFIFKEDRIEVFKCDEHSGKELTDLIKKTGSDIDIVIDDGSHILADQVYTCRILMPLLKKDVIYCIEDAELSRALVRRLREYKAELMAFRLKGKRDEKIVKVTNK